MLGFLVSGKSRRLFGAFSSDVALWILRVGSRLGLGVRVSGERLWSIVGIHVGVLGRFSVGR